MNSKKSPSSMLEVKPVDFHLAEQRGRMTSKNRFKLWNHLAEQNMSKNVFVCFFFFLRGGGEVNN